jgi:hypothetical protein
MSMPGSTITPNTSRKKSQRLGEGVMAEVS